jgi:hypothetical protein
VLGLQGCSITTSLLKEFLSRNFPWYLLLEAKLTYKHVC